MARGKVPSIKQSTQGRTLLLESVRLGFRHDSLADDLVASFRDLTP